jgi:L-alanine-DL-glutamate epimerase-like enolase superfamily enzyme
VDLGLREPMRRREFIALLGSTAIARPSRCVRSCRRCQPSAFWCMTLPAGNGSGRCFARRCLAELRRTSGIPIAAGENVSTLMDFERLLAAEAVDFVQPSPAKMGGISELRKIFPLAAVHNIPVMPHSFYDGPGLLAAIHATAALGTADSMIEWRWFDVEAPIYGGALTPKRGRISVPQGPGLGIDPDPDVIRAYRRK